jgi:hypothetical protein
MRSDGECIQLRRMPSKFTRHELALVNDLADARSSVHGPRHEPHVDLWPQPITNSETRISNKEFRIMKSKLFRAYLRRSLFVIRYSAVRFRNGRHVQSLPRKKGGGVKNGYPFKPTEFQEVPISAHDAGSPAFERTLKDSIISRISLDLLHLHPWPHQF